MKQLVIAIMLVLPMMCAAQEAVKLEAEAEKKEAELEAMAAKFEAEMERKEAQLEIQAAQLEAELEKKEAALEAEAAKFEAEMERREALMEAEADKKAWNNIKPKCKDYNKRCGKTLSGLRSKCKKKPNS